ncbi:DedA family protein, partial [Pantoea agglomerans]|nr:DedA family protein [Pantoea agglomerans]
KSRDWASAWLPPERLRWAGPLGLVIAVAAFVGIQFHPMMPIFRHLLWQVFFA